MIAAMEIEQPPEDLPLADEPTAPRGRGRPRKGTGPFQALDALDRQRSEQDRRLRAEMVNLVSSGQEQRVIDQLDAIERQGLAYNPVTVADAVILDPRRPFTVSENVARVSGLALLLGEVAEDRRLMTDKDMHAIETDFRECVTHLLRQAHVTTSRRRQRDERFAAVAYDLASGGLLKKVKRRPIKNNTEK